MDVQRGWALRPLPVNEVNEMVEMINDFMDMLVHSTITGICLAFWIMGRQEEKERQWKRQ